MEEVKETQSKKKGTQKKKEIQEVAEETKIEQVAAEDTVTVEPEVPEVKEQANPEPKKEEPKKETEVKEPLKKSTPQIPKHGEIPSLNDLIKSRGYCESVYTFKDGFMCNATSQSAANIKHNAWLAGE